MNDVISIYEAKTNLSKLVKKAQAGETIYIGAFGNPQAVIAPIPAHRPVIIGLLKGKSKAAYDDEDVIAADPAMRDLFYGSSLSSDEQR